MQASRLVVLLVMLGCATVTPRGALAEQAPAAPNIVLIVADDLGWGDLKVYNPDSQVALPALEALVAESVVVTDAHSASAVCAPSRYSVLSGNNPWRGRLLGGVWNPYKPSQLLPGQKSLADTLKGAGYKTGFFGKWHLGAQWRDHSGNITSDEESVDFSRGFFDGPGDHGFDEAATTLCGWQRSPYTVFDGEGQWIGELPAVWMQPPGDKWSSTSQSYEDLPAGYGEETWEQEAAADFVLEEAVDFIASHTSQRFFLHFNAFQPHWSWTATGQSGLSARVDQVLEFDHDVGVLLAALEAHGLTDNTVVVVTSDNGGDRLPEELANGHDASAHLRGQKGVIYEGGHRVPLLVRWPGVLEPATVGDEHRVGLQDLYATLAFYGDAPVESDQARDSFNQGCVLAKPEANPMRTTMIVQDNRGPNFAFYRTRFKLILDVDHEATELYDLQVDPSEQANLLGSQASLAQTLEAEFEAAYASNNTRPFSPAPGRDCLIPKDTSTFFTDGFESGDTSAWAEVEGE